MEYIIHLIWLLIMVGSTALIHWVIEYAHTKAYPHIQAPTTHTHERCTKYTPIPMGTAMRPYDYSKER